jgi:hypothetical protein
MINHLTWLDAPESASGTTRPLFEGVSHEIHETGRCRAPPKNHIERGVTIVHQRIGDSGTTRPFKGALFALPPQAEIASAADRALVDASLLRWLAIAAFCAVDTARAWGADIRERHTNLAHRIAVSGRAFPLFFPQRRMRRE